MNAGITKQRLVRSPYLWLSNWGK